MGRRIAGSLRDGPAARNAGTRLPTFWSGPRARLSTAQISRFSPSSAYNAWPCPHVAQDKLPLREKISYGFGDLASCLYWGSFSNFLLIFYTDVFGLKGGAIATMFFWSRI